jgi:hypothetical protein
MTKFTVLIEKKGTMKTYDLPIEDAGFLLQPENENDYRIWGFKGLPEIDTLSLEMVIELNELFKNKPEYVEDDVIETLLSVYGIERYPLVESYICHPRVGKKAIYAGRFPDPISYAEFDFCFSYSRFLDEEIRRDVLDYIDYQKYLDKLKESGFRFFKSSQPSMGYYVFKLILNQKEYDDNCRGGYLTKLAKVPTPLRSGVGMDSVHLS